MKYNLIYFIQSLLIIVLSPLFIGILKKMKAHLRGYIGSSIIQPYYDLSKLLKKGRIVSNRSSFITTIGPIVILAATITTAFFVPVFYTSMQESIGNLFILMFSFGIVKMFTVLIGLDSSSTFGGMGSSRESFISMMAEPLILFLMIFLYIETNDFNIFHISFINSKSVHYDTAYLITMVTFIVAILAENARIPFDNPETHLELTMMHEAMILDLSGSDLAYVELSSYIKLIVYLIVLINCFVPIGIATTISISAILIGLVTFTFKLLICLLGIAIIETTFAKSRLFKGAELFPAMISLGIVAITLIYIL
ncbi:respiratory chain complex I subunit 1 family protein [Clostridium estertheticum]|uniref:respiratory chain complex I subunit 1 family protein n=1 Tax=Clostridium estertheticum TaxID=238834 RepID=UPI001C0B70C4|nr:NADH-quinone oxidoreductase subunit H [Clostridium estertheticum]MBU3074559.1 NADH-quinone oxidoreductase subunit H [Clostridium estertheticum]MBU3164729.1 NADH-quinone oxidoreductase subunit H [Clostridium estertheticum]